MGNGKFALRLRRRSNRPVDCGEALKRAALPASGRSFGVVAVRPPGATPPARPGMPRRVCWPLLAKREGVSPSYFTRLVRLSYLAPDITHAILDGRQPRDLTAEKLLEHSRLPLAWPDQRTALGFA